jgi:hypothetical protein
MENLKITIKSILQLQQEYNPYTNGIESHSTLNGFPAAAWPLIGDDSWRSEG